MKRAFLGLTFLLSFIKVFPQNALSKHELFYEGNDAKKKIDSLAISSWVSLGNSGELCASNDGNYFSYAINSNSFKNKTIVVQSLKNTWKQEFEDAKPGFFSEDSKQFVFRKKRDLCFLRLSTNEIVTISNISDFKYSQNLIGRWIAYNTKADPNLLVLKDLSTMKEYLYHDVSNYMFDNNGSEILVMTEKKGANDRITRNLKLISLADMKEEILIAETDEYLGNFTFDDIGHQVAFILYNKEKDLSNELWYFRKGMEKPIMKMNTKSLASLINESDLFISNTSPVFSSDGKYIFFTLQKREPIKNSNHIKVDIWSYTDEILQSKQLLDIGPKTYYAAIGTTNDKVIRLENENDRINGFRGVKDYVVVESRSSINETWINNGSNNSFSLISLTDGTKSLLKEGNVGFYSFSPSGQHLVYFDSDSGVYFCRNMKTGLIRNVSKEIPTPLYMVDDFLVDKMNYKSGIPVGFAGWIEGEEAILVYDNNDVWEVDLVGRKKPVNVTNGFGKENHIKFIICNDFNDEKGLNRNEALLLGAFNTDNKYNGFYKKLLRSSANPELLIMGPYTLYHHNLQLPSYDEFDSGMKPLKLANKNSWIVKRQSAIEAPNYFLTNDFKTYKPLTNIQPQKNYNWLKSELISWQLSDNSKLQGVLYKPEDFDSTKKYPIIFHYYEQLSHRVYEFPEPGFARGRINIPWFVSQGYLVFTPDILYKTGYTGQSVYNSVVSAANHFASEKFVDSKRMGIQGHSFGGYETNFLVTSTDVFAAACSASGISNCISDYGSIAEGFGTVRQENYERGHENIGQNLWDGWDLFVKNSPIYRVNKVVTPLLIMHNKKDGAVPFAQSIEFFTALRRLGKKAWLLQYDDEKHTVYGDEAIDYTIRMTQFFDYYLKGKPAPKWMTQGISARMKGVNNGLELDFEKKTPQEGLYETVPKR